MIVYNNLFEKYLSDEIKNSLDSVFYSQINSFLSLRKSPFNSSFQYEVLVKIDFYNSFSETKKESLNYRLGFNDSSLYDLFKSSENNVRKAIKLIELFEEKTDSLNDLFNDIFLLDMYNEYVTK